MRGRTILAILVAVTLARPATAKVGPASLAELIAWSDLIVVGHVSEIDERDSNPFAMVVVEELWYGTSPSRVRVSLRPTWSCDGSRASLAERGVYFLGRENDGQWHISHSGHGRMPIVNKSVAVSQLVRLPGETGVRPASRDVPIRDLEHMIRSTLKKVTR